MSKMKQRLENEKLMAAFLQTKQVTVLPTYGKKRAPRAPTKEEEVVEIQVEDLPEALQKKYFAE